MTAFTNSQGGGNLKENSLPRQAEMKAPATKPIPITEPEFITKDLGAWSQRPRP